MDDQETNARVVLGPQPEQVTEVDMGVKDAKHMDRSEVSTEQEQFDTESLEVNTDESERDEDVEEPDDVGEVEVEEPVAVEDIETGDEWEGGDNFLRNQSGSVPVEAQQHWKDSWMPSYDQIAPTSQAAEGVCYFDGSTKMSAHSPVGNQNLCIDTQQAFCDGEKVYEPIMSNVGQQLYTDGQQFYTLACFEVPGPPPAASAMGPCMDHCAGVEQTVYPPYMGPVVEAAQANVVELDYWQQPCQQEVRQGGYHYRTDDEIHHKEINEEDAWNTCWDLVRPTNSW